MRLTAVHVRARYRPPGVLILATVIAAVGVRVALFSQISGDYTAFVGPWYQFIASHGGFAALQFNFANYNPPYLYLLTAATALPLPELAAIKTISVSFDFLMAFFVYLIVELRRPSPKLPWVCAAAVLFAPSVVVNSGAWAQCDSIYVSFCLGSLYFLLREKPWWASVFFGIALSFKLQAVFFLPVLLVVFVARPDRRLRSRVSLIAVPLVFLILLAPALIAGRGLGSLLDIYPDQVRTGGQVVSTATVGRPADPQTNGPAAGGSAPQSFGVGRPRRDSPGQGDPGGRTGPEATARPGTYTYNAANYFQWIGHNAPVAWRYLGFVLTALALAVIAIAAIARRAVLNRTQVVLLAATVALVVPFLLPDMHERYFYLADVLCIVAAGYRPKLWWAAGLATLCSLATYAPFLWGVTVVDLGLVAVIQLVVVVTVAAAFALSLDRHGDVSR